MTDAATATAFGQVLARTTPLVTELHTSSGFDGAAMLAVLRQRGHRGLALFESAGIEPGRPHRTIVVPRPWVRVVVRDGLARFEPLVDEAAELALQLERGARTEAPIEPCGGEERVRLRAPSVLDELRRAAGAVADREPGAPIPPGLFGAFSYELVDRFERLPARKPDPFDDPDASFALAGDQVVHEHDTGLLRVVTRGLPWDEARAVRDRHAATIAVVESCLAQPVGLPDPVDPAPAESDVDDRTFLRQVSEFRDAIGAGEIFQGVLSRGLTTRSEADPISVYAALRARNPSPYMFYLDLGDGELLGSSPETCLRVEGGVVEIRPIAGTVRRGTLADGTLDDDFDARLALSLLLDRKELAEHAMLLDLARNDVARVCEPGTTRVVEQFAPEKYSHVQHLVSRVQGRLRDGLDALHAYRAAANMGTLTGAPKVRAMELIRSTEPAGRGFYGGAAGYVLQDGRLDSCIVIRSLRHRDGVYHTRAGAGIVWQSSPEKELAETEHKSAACRAAIALAERAMR